MKKMSLAQRFLKEESGHALIYFLVALPAFLGVSLLAIDIGRGNNLHYDLQKAVDSLALAAAAELDGSPGAIDRATARLTGLLANRTRFSDNGEVVLDDSNVTARFLWTIPTSDDIRPIPGNMETDVDFDALFVEVTANAQGYTSIFPVSLALGRDTVNISATAVAGFGSAVCDFTPLFICNPFETANREESIQTLFDSVGDGRMITLRQQGGQQGQPLPGNFGFLEPPTGDKGANGLRELFARVRPEACFSRRQVTTKPGFAATITDAINVRFDIYDGPMSGRKNNGDYRPARNVRKGYGPKGQGQGQGNACNHEAQEDITRFMGLPRDTGFTSIQGGEIGNGLWDFEQYWDTNFPGQAGSYPNGWSNADPPSRFELYRYEIANGMTPEASVGGEIGDPACYSGGTAPNDTPDRRLVYGAIINCNSPPPEGFLGEGGKSSARPIAFGSFFITEALEKGGGGGERDNQTIRVELVDVTGPAGNGSLNLFQRNEAQLYR